MRGPMSDEEAQKWYNIINRAGRFIASDFPDVEFDDITQKFWEQLLGMNKRPDVDHYGVSKIVSIRLKYYAWGVRKEQWERSGRYLYRTSDVRTILETIFFQQEWVGGFVPEDARSWSPPNGMDAVDVRADISTAFQTLRTVYQDAIIERYLHQTNPEVDSPERKRLNRAISSLTDRLNYHYLGKQGRRVMSNASVQALLDNQEG